MGGPHPGPGPQAIAPPWLKPPITVRSQGIPRSSSSPFTNPPARPIVSMKVSAVGVADPLDHVPVAAAGRDVRERRAGRDAQQPALGVERVEQGEEVVLVHAAAVQEHQGALRLAGGLADPVHQGHAGRAAGPGVGLIRIARGT